MIVKMGVPTTLYNLIILCNIPVRFIRVAVSGARGTSAKYTYPHEAHGMKHTCAKLCRVRRIRYMRGWEICVKHRTSDWDKA